DAWRDRTEQCHSNTLWTKPLPHRSSSFSSRSKGVISALLLSFAQSVTAIPNTNLNKSNTTSNITNPESCHPLACIGGREHITVERVMVGCYSAICALALLTNLIQVALGGDKTWITRNREVFFIILGGWGSVAHFALYDSHKLSGEK